MAIIPMYPKPRMREDFQASLYFVTFCSVVLAIHSSGHKSVIVEFDLGLEYAWYHGK